MQAETKPVSDSVPKVNDEIAVGSDLEFQRGWWRFERVSWIALAIIIALDVAGVFGRGPVAKAHQQLADGSMTVNYERIERFSTPSIMTVNFSQSAITDGKIQLWVSEVLVKGLGNQRIVPQPEKSAIGEGGIFYTFDATRQPASVEFALQPASAGRYHLTLRCPGHGELHPSVFVMP